LKATGTVKNIARNSAALGSQVICNWSVPTSLLLHWKDFAYFQRRPEAAIVHGSSSPYTCSEATTPQVRYGEPKHSSFNLIRGCCVVDVLFPILLQVTPNLCI